MYIFLTIILTLLESDIYFFIVFIQTSPIALPDQIFLFAPYQSGQGERKDLLRINRIRTVSPTVFG